MKSNISVEILVIPNNCWIYNLSDISAIWNWKNYINLQQKEVSGSDEFLSNIYFEVLDVFSYISVLIIRDTIPLRQLKSGCISKELVTSVAAAVFLKNSQKESSKWLDNPY